MLVLNFSILMALQGHSLGQDETMFAEYQCTDCYKHTKNTMCIIALIRSMK